MKIYQVLTTLSFGDAVSNDALAIMNLLPLPAADCLNPLPLLTINPALQRRRIYC